MGNAGIRGPGGGAGRVDADVRCVRRARNQRPGATQGQCLGLGGGGEGRGGRERVWVRARCACGCEARGGRTAVHVSGLRPPLPRRPKPPPLLQATAHAPVRGQEPVNCQEQPRAGATATPGRFRVARASAAHPGCPANGKRPLSPALHAPGCGPWPYPGYTQPRAAGPAGNYPPPGAAVWCQATARRSPHSRPQSSSARPSPAPPVAQAAMPLWRSSASRLGSRPRKALKFSSALRLPPRERISSRKRAPVSASRSGASSNAA